MCVYVTYIVRVEFFYILYVGRDKQYSALYFKYFIEVVTMKLNYDNINLKNQTRKHCLQ